MAGTGGGAFIAEKGVTGGDSAVTGRTRFSRKGVTLPTPAAAAAFFGSTAAGAAAATLVPPAALRRRAAAVALPAVAAAAAAAAALRGVALAAEAPPAGRLGVVAAPGRGVGLLAEPRATTAATAGEGFSFTAEGGGLRCAAPACGRRPVVALFGKRARTAAAEGVAVAEPGVRAGAASPLRVRLLEGESCSAPSTTAGGAKWAGS